MKPFRPVTSNKLYIQIYHQIHDAIISGQYAVGEKLPSEKELCEMFNVSRVPVREALSALELNGLVDSTRGAGVYVARTTHEGDEWILDIDPRDIITTRMELEPKIARLAASQISEKQRDELNEIMERFQKEMGEDSYSMAVDKEFHLFLARISGNMLYAKIMELVFKTMESRMQELIRNRTAEIQEYREQNNREHLQIAQAVLNGHSNEAFACMKEHMEHSYDRYWR